MTPKSLVSLAGLLLAACGAPGATAPAPGAAPVATVSVEAPAAAPPGGPPSVISTPREEIAALEQLYAGTARSSPERPRLLRRLAEAYVTLESSALREDLEHLIRAAEATRKGDADRATAEKEAAARSMKRAESARDKAIEHYTRLAEDHPSYCHGGADPAKAGCGDEVLFYLAFEYEQARKPDEARRAYREILTRWPMSRYVPNAHLAFAEQLFEQGMANPGKLADAEKEYLEVLRVPPPENKVACYAHYKLGWVYWNRAEFARALVEMTKAIEVSAQSPNGPALAKSARRDLVPLYAASGDPRKAHAFFSKWSGDPPGKTDGLHRLLDDLGQKYLDIGKSAEAVELYLDWFDRGVGPKACEKAREIVASAGAPKDPRTAAAFQAARTKCP